MNKKSIHNQNRKLNKKLKNQEQMWNVQNSKQRNSMETDKTFYSEKFHQKAKNKNVR